MKRLSDERVAEVAAAAEALNGFNMLAAVTVSAFWTTTDENDVLLDLRDARQECDALRKKLDHEVANRRNVTSSKRKGHEVHTEFRERVREAERRIESTSEERLGHHVDGMWEALEILREALGDDA